MEETQRAAKSLKFDMQLLKAQRQNQIEGTILTAAKMHVDAIVVTDDLLFVGIDFPRLALMNLLTLAA